MCGAATRYVKGIAHDNSLDSSPRVALGSMRRTAAQDRIYNIMRSSLFAAGRMSAVASCHLTLVLGGGGGAPQQHNAEALSSGGVPFSEHAAQFRRDGFVVASV